MMRVALCTNASRHVNLNLLHTLYQGSTAAAMSEPSGAMSNSEDELLAKEMETLSDDLIDDLHKYLDEISTTGHFATIKKLHKSVDPQVQLIGTDDIPGHDIPIPLGSRDALKLIEAAQPAPSGKGEETIVDTSVGRYVLPNLGALCVRSSGPVGN
jgi:hypothetical protein